MCSPRRAHLNALRGFFHTEFVEEISAKYWENPGGRTQPGFRAETQFECPPPGFSQYFADISSTKLSMKKNHAVHSNELA